MNELLRQFRSFFVQWGVTPSHKKTAHFRPKGLEKYTKEIQRGFCYFSGMYFISFLNF